MSKTNRLKLMRVMLQGVMLLEQRLFNTGNATANQSKVIRCYNCRGEGHIARQCTQLKRVHNLEWFKEKMQLAQAQEARVALDEEHIAFLEDKGKRVNSDPAAQALTTNVIFKTDDVLSEVPNYNTFHDNIVFEHNVQEMQYSEQPVIDDDLNIKITSDNNVISYDQYLKESKYEVFQSIASPDQQNEMIMSVIKEMSSQVAKCNAVNQENKTVNESLTAELERCKEQINFFEERQIFDLTDREKYIDGQMRALGYENPLYLTQAQRKQPALYCGHTIVKKHDALSMIDTEETLILAEESRIKMFEKQNDPIMNEKRVDITPIDYTALNGLYEHFVITVKTKVTGQNEGTWGFEHIRGAFNKEVIPFVKTLKEYFQMFDQGLAKEITHMKEVFNQMETEVEQCSVDRKCFEIQKKELFIENDRLLEKIIFQDYMCTAMHVSFEHKCVLPANDNNLAYVELEKSYIAEYSKVLELKAELVKKKDMIEQDVFIELLKSYSKLEKHFISLEITMQQSKESSATSKEHNNRQLEKPHSRVERKSVADCTESVNKSKVIAGNGYSLKDKNEAKTDKTKHENG
ncbi:integrase, catalytic region, zinc finger, CCHC-type containing protein [Tanacetum coccineum]